MSAKGQKRTLHGSLDHIIGAGKQRRRNCQAKRLGRGEIDDKLKFCRLLDWDVARFCPVQNLVDVIFVGSRSPSASVRMRARLATMS